MGLTPTWRPKCNYLKNRDGSYTYMEAQEQFDFEIKRKCFFKSLKWLVFNEMKNNQKVNIFGIFWHDHKIGVLNDKCAKNHLKMRSFDRLKQLLKLWRKLRKLVIKIKEWVSQGLNPRPLFHNTKSLPAEPRACGDKKWLQKNI